MSNINLDQSQLESIDLNKISLDLNFFDEESNFDDLNLIGHGRRSKVKFVKNKPTEELFALKIVNNKIFLKYINLIKRNFSNYDYFR